MLSSILLPQDGNYAHAAEAWAIALLPADSAGFVFVEELYLDPSCAGSGCRIPAALRQSSLAAAVNLVDEGALFPELGRPPSFLMVSLGTSSMSVWNGLTVVSGFVLSFPYP